jgi:hypothetical protein
MLNGTVFCDACGQVAEFVKVAYENLTSEFTGLRGFLRRSGGMMGYASFHGKGWGRPNRLAAVNGEPF